MFGRDLSFLGRTLRRFHGARGGCLPLRLLWTLVLEGKAQMGPAWIPWHFIISHHLPGMMRLFINQWKNGRRTSMAVAWFWGLKSQKLDEIGIYSIWYTPRKLCCRVSIIVHHLFSSASNLGIACKSERFKKRIWNSNPPKFIYIYLFTTYFRSKTQPTAGFKPINFVIQI